MNTVKDKKLPILIKVISVILIIFGCLGLYDLVFDNEELEILDYIWTVVDLLTGFGLMLRWKAAYILLLIQFSLLIISGTVGFIFMLFVSFDGGSIDSTKISITLGLFGVVVLFSYLYRLVRRNHIKEIYFKNESNNTLQPTAEGGG